MLMLMVGLAIWGCLLALGALLFGFDPQTGGISLSISPTRGLIVLACVAGFLGFWSLLLLGRRRASARKKD
jgi:hypothetical protein